MKAKWENEKNAIGRVQQLRERIEQINRDIESAEQSYDLEKAAKLKYGDLPEAKKQLEQEENWRKAARRRVCSATRSRRRRSPRSSSAGQASRPRG